jgi:uncharacterized protein (DUF2141 family)
MHAGKTWWLATLAAALLAQAAFAQESTIRVQVSGFRNGQGNLACALFAQEEGFLNGEFAQAKVKSAVALPMSECVFTGVKPGRYAVSVLHDENGNGELDKYWLFGIPKEGYGVSNNKTYATHAPRFEESAFAIGGEPELLLKVTLRY